MYGLDLLDFFRGRHTWRKLLNLLAHLPASSAYIEAVANDEEYAAAAAAQEPPTRAGPRLSEWTPEVDYLARVVDRLGELIRATVAAAGHKPGEVRPEPRPVTAVDRARSDRRYRKHLSLVEEVRQAQARYAAMRG